MQKERNYTIEFYRFMLAINFCLIHVLLVFPMFVFGSNVPFFASGMDVIIPFMSFAGYFLMQGFEKQREKARLLNLTPQRQAWTYLKARLVGLGPAYLVASIAGWLMLNIWNGNRIIDWPIHLLNSVFELFGLQVTGAGFGNASVGLAWFPDAYPPVLMLGSPLWFISGIFVCGYLIYFLLASNKNRFIGFIAPLSALLFYGSQHLAQEQPMWYQFTTIGGNQSAVEFTGGGVGAGGINIAQGWPLMFVGLSLGCVLYVAVQNLKDKKWSKGTIGFLTIAQIILSAVVIIRSWVPVFVPLGEWFNLNWSSVHLLTLIFTFLVLLNVDKCTRFKLFSSKIWKTPGRLSFYFYMLHWPIIYIVAMAMGMHGLDLSYITMDNMMEVLTTTDVMKQFILLFVITTIVSLVVAYLFMLLDTKVIQPWLKNRPWYNKEQKELEKIAVEAEANRLSAAIADEKSKISV